MGFLGGGAGGIGGSTGATDNAILRADGTGGATLQNSDLNVDDASISTQNNVAITNQHNGQTDSALVLTPKGTGGIIAGARPSGTATGGNARGINAVDLQISRGNANQVASGNYSVIAGGLNNQAREAYNFVGGGRGNTAQGAVGGDVFASVVGGDANSAQASFTSIGGGFSNLANADSAFVAGGRSAKADRPAMFAHASGPFSTQGDAQSGRFVLRCKTITNSAVEMGMGGAATAFLTIPSGKVIFCNIKIVGTKSDGSAVATYERQYAVKNVGGTSTEIYTPRTIGTDNAAGTTISVTTNDTGDYISIRPTGILNETWRWVAVVDAVEVAYGA